MAIASNDRLLVQRSGALRSIECGNIINLQSGDLLVVQRSSGMGNLRKIDWANKDTDLQDSDMMFVSDVSTTGNTLKKTTWGAVKAFLSATATILASGNGSSSNQNLTLDDLFTQTQLAGNMSKTINIESGAIVGGNTAGGIALDISSTNTVNGTITINNNGTIVGRQGGLSSINGATAISFSKNATLVNNGTISGGGGQGGNGGQGGTGSYAYNYGAANYYTTAGVFTSACDNSCHIRFGTSTSCAGTSSTVTCDYFSCLINTCTCSTCPGTCTSTTYICSVTPSQGTYFYTCDQCEGTAYQTGGTGGTGGFGAGFTSSSTNVSASSGTSGTAPGNNSGAGGNGGAGGNYGQAGSAGAAGANGNHTNGSAGSSAGNGGSSIAKNSNTVTVTNNGTINGSITT